VAAPDPGTDEPRGQHSDNSIAEQVGRARLHPPAGTAPVLLTGHLSGLVEGSETPLARVAALGKIVQTAFRYGRAGETLAAIARQREAAGDDPAALVWALSSSVACRAVFGQLRGARADLAEVRKACKYAAPLLAEPFWRFAETICCWLEGNWAAAHAGAAKIDKDQTSLPPPLAGTIAALRVDLLRAVGMTDESRELAGRLSGAPAEISAWALAGLDADDGRPEEALRRLAEVCDAGERSVYRLALPFVLYRMAEVAFSCGDHGVTSFAAAALADLDQVAPLNAILAGLARAYTADDPGPAAQALELAEAEGAGMLVAEAITVRGMTGDVRSLPAAHDAWIRIGASGKARAVAASIRAAGLPAPLARYQVSRVPAADKEALTARERALARLVHEGRTNQQIARALSISVKTVEAYLTRLYRKTSCSSRVELAVAVTQRRIEVDE
jgi:DNA-binding CsgD family transcriptional regulator